MTNLRRAGLAVLAACALTLTAPAAGASAAPRGWPLPDVAGLIPGLYAVNVASQQCLAAPGGSGPASQRRCVSDDAYRWKLVPASLDGRFKVENAASGRCLVPSGALEVAVGSCGNGPGYTWNLEDAPGTGVYVINSASRQCLTIGRDGGAVEERCNGDVSRRWSFRRKPNDKGVVKINDGTP